MLRTRLTAVWLIVLILALFLAPVQALNTGKMYVAPGPIQIKTSAGLNRILLGTDGKITMVNSETIDNATNGTINLTTTVLKQTFDSNDYLTVTLANSTGPVFDSVVNGGAGSFTFSDPITVTAAATTDALYLNGTASTTGDALCVKFVDATLTTGKYLNFLGGNGTVEVFSVGEDGATAITSTGVATNSLSITNVASTSGDLLTLTLDDDTADADVFYISCLGGTDHATSVFTLGEGGIATFKGGATIDNATSATTLTITETNVAVAGILDADNYVQGTINTDATGTVAVGAGLTDSGEMFIATKSDGATTYTLPDPSAATVGAVWTFVQTADQAMNIVPTTADGNSIIADGVATSDKVSIETGSHKIGGAIRVYGISATKYLAVAMSGATMTIEAAD